MIKESIIIEKENVKLCINKVGILKISFKRPIVSLEDVKEITNLRNNIPHLQDCYPVLMNISNITLSSLKVLKYGQQKARPDLTQKLGLVVNSPTSRIIGNLFLNLYTPKFPIRLFSNEEVALKWLKI